MLPPALRNVDAHALEVMAATFKELCAESRPPATAELMACISALLELAEHDRTACCSMQSIRTSLLCPSKVTELRPVSWGWQVARSVSTI